MTDPSNRDDSANNSVIKISDADDDDNDTPKSPDVIKISDADDDDDNSADEASVTCSTSYMSMISSAAIGG